MRRSRSVPVVVGALLTAAALAGCTAVAGTSGGASGGGGSSRSAVDFQSGTGRMPLTADSPQAEQKAPVDRSIVTTGSLRLVTDHPIRTAQRVTQLVLDADGRVARSDQDPGDRPSASLQLRIPAAAFQRVLDAVEQQGDVRDVSIRATDVTAKVTDYGVRIANLRTSIARLQQLLAKATSSTALVQIEGALTDRQGNLEQLLAEQRALADEVAYSTLSVSIVVPAAAPRTGPSDFLAGLVAGTRALVETVAAITVGLGVALPWLVVLGALAAGGAFLARVVRRRTRASSA